MLNYQLIRERFKRGGWQTIRHTSHETIFRPVLCGKQRFFRISWALTLLVIIAIPLLTPPPTNPRPLTMAEFLDLYPAHIDTSAYHCQTLIGDLSDGTEYFVDDLQSITIRNDLNLPDDQRLCSLSPIVRFLRLYNEQLQQYILGITLVALAAFILLNLAQMAFFVRRWGRVRVYMDEGTATISFHGANIVPTTLAELDAIAVLPLPITVSQLLWRAVMLFGVALLLILNSGSFVLLLYNSRIV